MTFNVEDHCQNEQKQQIDRNKQNVVKPKAEILETKPNPMISRSNRRQSKGIKGGGSNMRPLGHCSYQKLKKGSSEFTSLFVIELVNVSTC